MYENLIKALRNVNEYDSGYAKLMYDAADVIEELTAADVRPVVRGKWEYISFMTVKCSNCQETFQELAWDNFCPNCGADMREES